MFGILKQRLSSGALGVSSSTILAKSLRWIRTTVPEPTSRMTGVTTGRGLGASESKLKYLGDCALLPSGPPASANGMRGETLDYERRRHLPSFKDLPLEERFLPENAVEFGRGHDLPSPPVIELCSSEGEQIMVEALFDRSAKGFFPLTAVRERPQQCIPSYSTASYGALSEPGSYALASISAALNALKYTSGNLGSWRVCFDFLLKSCDSFEKVIADGLTLGKLAFLAHCNGTKVEVFQGNQCTIDDFRENVVKCATLQDNYMILFFDRAHFMQIGGGHISPIGAYHAGRDLVLVMDVSRFVYPWFWIPLPLLWKAMTSIDQATGNHMGFMVLSRLPHDPCMLYTLNCRDESWMRTANHLSKLPLLLKSEDVKGIDEIFSVLLRSDSTNFRDFIKHVAEVCGQKDGYKEPRKKERKRLAVQEQLLRQLHETELYSHVSRWMDKVNSDCGVVTSSGNKHALPQREAKLRPGSFSQSFSTISANCSEANFAGNDALTMMLFALPSHMWSGILNPKLSAEFNSLVSLDNLPQMLKNETGIKTKNSEELPNASCFSRKSLILFLKRFEDNNHTNKDRRRNSPTR